MCPSEWSSWFFTDSAKFERNYRIFLLSGYHSLPHEQLYWTTAEGVSVPILREAIARSMYLSMENNLNLYDITKLNTNNKLAKLRTYLDKLNTNFLKYGTFSHNLSIDDEMIL